MENKYDDIYELRKDVSLPNGYMRAGERKTRRDWDTLFPGCFDFHRSEWFINITERNEERQESLERDIVSEIFDQRGLKSISYMEAAVACIVEYKRKTKK